MLFHFKDKLPQLNHYWDKYLEFQKRIDVPAKTVLLKEGTVSGNYIFLEKGCIRAYINNNGVEKTVQFFFENEGLASLESFLENTPSLLTVETIESSIVYLLPKKFVNKLMADLGSEPGFVNMIIKMMAERQIHYMNEFVSFIRDTPEQRYLNLLHKKPHIIQRVPQHYIASYLGISRVHLSRIKSALTRKK